MALGGGFSGHKLGLETGKTVGGRRRKFRVSSREVGGLHSEHQDFEQGIGGFLGGYTLWLFNIAMENGP